MRLRRRPRAALCRVKTVSRPADGAHMIQLSVTQFSWDRAARGSPPRTRGALANRCRASMSEHPRRQSASRTVTIQLKRHTLLMLPLVGLLFGAAPYAQPGGSRQRPAAPSASFRASVDVVSLNVIVSDRENRLVLDLDWPDFSVFEDGIKQDVTFFTRGRQSIALSLLIDSSASMVDHLPMLHAAATNLVHRLGPSDLAQIVDFDSRVYVRQAFTSKRAELEAAIRQTIARGSTSLYSAVYVALKELGKVRAVSEANVRRHALIVFSDGEDTSSLVAFEDVLDLAKRSETAVYAIAFRGPDTRARGFREAEYVLRTLAQETGGRAFLPGRIEDLADIYAQIGEELASQYTIGYTSKNATHDGAWRRVIVQVSRPNTRARAKNGYYAPRTR